MSEVLTRSLATSFSTALPILALLLFGGDTLKDFAFALLIGTISGTYSSIFIASPVLTHWKEREPLYARRHDRVARENNGLVPAFALATVGGAPVDVVPAEKPARRSRRLTEPEQVSKEEFDDMVRDLHPEPPRDPTADATPEEVVMPSTSTRRTNGDPKPKRDKQKRPRNRRHGRSR
jgi:SecD/SecF fusion protein